MTIERELQIAKFRLYARKDLLRVGAQLYEYYLQKKKVLQQIRDSLPIVSNLSASELQLLIDFKSELATATKDELINMIGVTYRNLITVEAECKEAVLNNLGFDINDLA